MTGEWREFTVETDVDLRRRLDENDLVHLQNVADPSPRLHDVVLIYDEDANCLSTVFQIEALTPILAVVGGAEAFSAILSSIGMSHWPSFVRLSVDRTKTEVLREDYQTLPL